MTGFNGWKMTKNYMSDYSNDRQRYVDLLRVGTSKIGYAVSQGRGRYI